MMAMLASVFSGALDSKLAVAVACPGTSQPSAVLTAWYRCFILSPEPPKSTGITFPASLTVNPCRHPAAAENWGGHIRRV